MKHKSFPKLLKSVLIGLIVCLGLLCFYYGWSFAPGSRRSDEEEAAGSDGFDPVFGGSLTHRDFDDLHDDRLAELPKSIPVRNLITALRTPFCVAIPIHYII